MFTLSSEISPQNRSLKAWEGKDEAESRNISGPVNTACTPSKDLNYMLG